MKKKLFILPAIALMAVAAGLTACSNAGDAVKEDTTFNLVVRQYNGVDSSYNAKLDGNILAQKTIDVKAGQVTVSEALALIAPAEDGAHKISFTETDYLVFTETTVGYTTSWYLNNGHFDAEPNYISGDFEWSYMAYNGHYSNGVTVDFLDGLTTYTIVIDGYDGNTGSNPSW